MVSSLMERQFNLLHMAKEELDKAQENMENACLAENSSIALREAAEHNNKVLYLEKKNKDLEKEFHQHTAANLADRFKIVQEHNAKIKNYEIAVDEFKDKMEEYNFALNETNDHMVEQEKMFARKRGIQG